MQPWPLGADDDDVRTPALLRALTAAPVDVATLILELHGRVHDEDSLLDLMVRASQEAVRMIADAQWAGVTSVLAGKPLTAAHTDDRVLIVDEGQYDQGDGPCLTAARSDRTVAMTLADVRDRWPALADVADAAGVRSFHAEPLHVLTDCVGSLNVYSARGDGLRVPNSDILTVLVEYLERGLTAYLGTNPQFDSYLRLATALSRRRVTNSAVGVLMAVHRIDRDRATELLDSEAARRGMSVQRIAAEIVDTHTPKKS